MRSKTCLFLGLASAMFLFNCGNDDSSSASTFLDATRNTLPVLSASTSVTAITWGTMSEEIKAVFMDPAEDTTLGVNNLYHLLNDLDGATSQVRETTCARTAITGISTTPYYGSDVDSDGFFSPAFDLAYTCYDNQLPSSSSSNTSYLVGKRVGNVHHAIYSLSGGCGGSATCDGTSIYQGVYDESTQDLRVRLVGYWEGFSMRSEFYGNAGTHTFTLRLTKANFTSGALTPGSYWIEMRGYGVSQGTGSFLIKASDEAGLTNKYYCYDAATKNAIDVTSTIGTSSCAGYKATVDAMTAISHTTGLAAEPFTVTLSTY